MYTPPVTARHLQENNQQPKYEVKCSLGLPISYITTLFSRLIFKAVSKCSCTHIFVFEVISSILFLHATLETDIDAGCFRRNLPCFQRTFIRLIYVDITKYTYLNS
jgi:hypothetical protein